MKTLAGLWAVWIGLGSAPAHGAGVSFRHEVMAVLSKAGCNQGTCHGNANGKGGFKLSLRGEDPDFDFDVITRGEGGRRVNALEPAQSLLLIKPTGQIAHEGGKRFGTNSREYKVLAAWIAAGMKRDSSTLPRLARLEVAPAEKLLVEPTGSAQLHVTAVLANGARRDVTVMAVYEPTNDVVTVSREGLARKEKFGETTVVVRYLDRQIPARLTFIPARLYVWRAPPERNVIDRHVFAKLRALRLNPSELCSDSDFLRRAHLDLLGLIPTKEAAQSFLAETSPDKRARLIGTLLARREFAEHWAQKWSDVLRNEEKALDRRGVETYYNWMRDSLAANKQLDVFAREIIAARGSTYAVPPANYYRSLRNPVTRGETTAQVFLGVRLQCAQCHNHPFDRWTQDDYYDWLGLFARVDYKILENNRRDNLDSHEFIGEQIVEMKKDGYVRHPKTNRASLPRFLGTHSTLADGDDYLRKLADWLTSPDNTQFARAQVNRVWFHLMGRGLVDPIDDFRATNPPTHSALLEELTRQFISSGHDLKWLIRTIMNSTAYQLSSTPDATNAEDEVNYARALPRRLTAEQLLDAIHQTLDVPTRFNGYPVGTRATQLPGVLAVRAREQRASPGDQFLTLFGKPQRLLSCECERNNEPTLNQALHLISGAETHELLKSASNRLSAWLQSGKTNAEIVDELYGHALSRRSSATEQRDAVAYLEKSSDRRAALEDVTWAVLNAKEFVLRK